MAGFVTAFTDIRFLHIFGMVLGSMILLYAFLYFLIDSHDKHKGMWGKRTRPAPNTEWWMYAVLAVPQTSMSVTLPAAVFLVGIVLFVFALYLIQRAVMMNRKLTLYANPRKTLLTFKNTTDVELQKEGIQKIADLFGEAVPPVLVPVHHADRILHVVTLLRDHALEDHREFVEMLYSIAGYQNDVLLASTLNAIYRIKK